MKHLLPALLLLSACNNAPTTLSAPPAIYVAKELSELEFEQVQDAADMWIDATKAAVVTDVVRGEAKCGIYVRYLTAEEFTETEDSSLLAQSETLSFSCVHELKLRKDLPSEYDKVRIFAHELGHMLGGKPGWHSKNENSLMYGDLFFDRDQYVTIEDVNMVLDNLGLKE